MGSYRERTAAPEKQGREGCSAPVFVSLEISLVDRRDRLQDLRLREFQHTKSGGVLQT